MDQKISDLDVAISMTASDLIPIVDTNGNNKVLHGAQVKDYVADAVVSDIDDVKAMISDEYDPDRVTPYEAGDLVIYNNTLYICLDTTSGTWNSSKWEAKTITSLLESKANSSDFIYDIQTVVFDSSGVGTITSPNGYTALSAILDNNWFVAVMSNTALIAHNRFDYTNLIKSTSVSIGIFFIKFN